MGVTRTFGYSKGHGNPVVLLRDGASWTIAESILVPTFPDSPQRIWLPTKNPSLPIRREEKLNQIDARDTARERGNGGNVQLLD